MSERGSFVTEYIYCNKCFEAAKGILLKKQSLRDMVAMVGSQILAGKIGGLYSGEELDVFEYEIMPNLAKVLCHPMRVAVLAESGEQIFTVQPTVRPCSGSAI